jgi:hypothetical protein
MTFLATMDEDGYCHFAAIGNVAQRAVVTPEEAKTAITILELPDVNSSDPAHEGRRIERVPGGWMVLNAPKYRELATREHAKEKNRTNVRAFRERKKQDCNGDVIAGNKSVTPSEAYTETETEKPREIEVEFHVGDPEKVFAIAKAHPRLTHLRNETEIPRAVVDEIIRAIGTDGAEVVLEGTKAYAESVDNPKFATNPWDFFHTFDYRIKPKPQLVGNPRQRATQDAIDKAFS